MFLVNARFVKPLDTEMLERLSEKHRYVMILEENIETGGYGEQVLAYVAGRGLPMKVRPVGIPDQFVEHGDIGSLRSMIGMEKDRLIKQIEEECR